MRMSEDELRRLRELPGENDSDRVRYLIHAIDRLESADREIAEIRQIQKLIIACFDWQARAFKAPDGSRENLKATIQKVTHEAE